MTLGLNPLTTCFCETLVSLSPEVNLQAPVGVKRGSNLNSQNGGGDKVN